MITIDSPKRYIHSAFYNLTGTALHRCIKISTSAFHISVPNIAEVCGKEIQRPLIAQGLPSEEKSKAHFLAMEKTLNREFRPLPVFSFQFSISLQNM